MYYKPRGLRNQKVLYHFHLYNLGRHIFAFCVFPIARKENIEQWTDRKFNKLDF